MAIGGKDYLQLFPSLTGACRLLQHISYHTVLVGRPYPSAAKEKRNRGKEKDKGKRQRKYSYILGRPGPAFFTTNILAFLLRP